MPKPTKELWPLPDAIVLPTPQVFQILPGDTVNTQRLAYQTPAETPLELDWGPNFKLSLVLVSDLVCEVDHAKAKVTLGEAGQRVHVLEIKSRAFEHIFKYPNGVLDLHYGIGLAIKTLIESEVAFVHEIDATFQQVQP